MHGPVLRFHLLPCSVGADVPVHLRVSFPRHRKMSILVEHIFCAEADPGTRVLRKYNHSHTPPHRLARTSEIRTVLEAYWLVRAPVPILRSGSRDPTARRAVRRGPI